MKNNFGHFFRITEYGRPQETIFRLHKVLRHSMRKL